MSFPTRASALSLASMAIAVAVPLPLPAVAVLPSEEARADRPPPPPLAPIAALGPPSTPRKLRKVERLPRPPAPRLVFPVRAAFNWGQGGAQFGADRGGRSHEGQDVMAPAGSPLVAMTDGVVLETGNDGGRGNYLALYDPRLKLTYVYLHLQSAPRVSPGEEVRAGGRVGEVGCTGSCFGDHLHFEARQGQGASGRATDPRPLLNRALAGSGPAATLPPGAS